MKYIRNAELKDLPGILLIYQEARRFMEETGNPNQWTNGYPSQEAVERDLQKDCLYVCADGETLLAAFYYAEEDDPTYCTVYGGAWLNALPYGVIHRMAVAKNARGTGIAAFIFDSCYRSCGNLKIDTHKDNAPMRRSLEKNGFQYCGVIHLLNGGERVAYQRCRPSGIKEE